MIPASLYAYLKGFIGALIAVVVCALAYTAYADHQTLKTIVTYLNQAAAKAQAQK